MSALELPGAALAGVSLVAFGLGTFYAPFAVANFEHVTAGTLGLAAFALAWRGRPALAGVTGGAALLVANEAALIVLIVAMSRFRPAGRS